MAGRKMEGEGTLVGVVHLVVVQQPAVDEVADTGVGNRMLRGPGAEEEDVVGVIGECRHLDETARLAVAEEEETAVRLHVQGLGARRGGETRAMTKVVYAGAIMILVCFF